MLSDDEIKDIAAVGIELGRENFTVRYARAIIAAYQAKLLAGVEIPEPYGELSNGYREFHGIRKKGYTQDQLQQYAAACAAQAREKALDEAKGVCEAEFTVEGVAQRCAAAIDKLKGGE